LNGSCGGDAAIPDFAIFIPMGLVWKLAVVAAVAAVLAMQDGLFSPLFPLPPERFAILVTGAGSGIGDAFVSSFAAKHGERVRVFAVVRTARDFGATNVVSLVVADVGNASAVADAARTVEAADAQYPLFAVVNNAGVSLFGPFEYTATEKLEQVLRTNLLGPMLVARQFLPLLKKNRGRLVNIGSLSGERALSMASVYAGSKFGLRGWGEGLRRQLAGRVAVSLVSAFEIACRSNTVQIEPGFVRTRMARDAFGALENVPKAQQGEYGHHFSEANTRRMAGLMDRFAVTTEATDAAIEHAISDARPRTRYLMTNVKYIVYLFHYLPDWAQDKIQLLLERPPESSE
jgi:NAD(P)-dependent dehydrogenase (short-subunit alcohol dehydrogenase family)